MGGGLPRNYEVIGDICESSFNPFVLSMNMQERHRNEPTMFPMLVVAPSGREIRFDDASSIPGVRKGEGIDIPGLSFACESGLVLVWGM